jgi:hypothetical protein
MRPRVGSVAVSVFDDRDARPTRHANTEVAALRALLYVDEHRAGRPLVLKFGALAIAFDGERVIIAVLPIEKTEREPERCRRRDEHEDWCARYEIVSTRGRYAP